MSVFRFWGADLGNVEAFIWNSATEIDFMIPVPQDLTQTDWVALSAPAMNELNADGEWFDSQDCWLGDYGIYWLLRFGSIPEGTVGVWSAQLNECTLWAAILDESQPLYRAVGA